MRIPLRVGRVSGIHPFSFWLHHVRQQNKDYSRLAGTQESQGYSILLRFRKLLLLVHLQLLGHCHSIDMPHLEGHSLEVRLLLCRCFQLSQESIYLCSHPYSLDSRCSTHRGNWSVFHVSMLKPAMSNTFSERMQLVSTPVIIDGEPKYEISQIVDSKIDCWQACKLLYKVIWLGYEDTGDKSEWIPTSELSHAADLVSDFHIAYPAKPGPLPLSWSCCCICPLPPRIPKGDFPSLISSIFCPLIFINPQLLHTFQGFLLKTSSHSNSCFFLLTHLIHRK